MKRSKRIILAMMVLALVLVTVAATGAYGSLAYTYDLVGNRLMQTLGGAVTTYSYAAGTNRLASITASGVWSAA